MNSYEIQQSTALFPLSQCSHKTPIYQILMPTKDTDSNKYYKRILSVMHPN